MERVWTCNAYVYWVQNFCVSCLNYKREKDKSDDQKITITYLDKYKRKSSDNVLAKLNGY